MVNYYRQQAARTYSYSSGGSSSSKSSGSSSSGSTSKKTTWTSTGIHPMDLAQIAQGAISSGLPINSYVSNILKNTVSVPKYGEITYDDLEILQKNGLVRVDGVDASGKPKVTPLVNKNYSGFIQMTR